MGPNRQFVGSSYGDLLELGYQTLPLIVFCLSLGFITNTLFRLTIVKKIAYGTRHSYAAMCT